MESSLRQPTTNTHGGYRPGAGRKPTGRKKQVLYITDAEHAQVKELINKLREEAKMKNLYKEWRKVSEEMLQDGYAGSLDCGEPKVREDFSTFAELEEEITFEDMFRLEKEYEAE